MKYRFPITITDVFERKLAKHVRGVGNEAVFETHSDGWYIRVNDKFSIYMGPEKPKFEIGEKAELQLVRK